MDSKGGWNMSRNFRSCKLFGTNHNIRYYYGNEQGYADPDPWKKSMVIPQDKIENKNAAGLSHANNATTNKVPIMSPEMGMKRKIITVGLTLP